MENDFSVLIPEEIEYDVPDNANADLRKFNRAQAAIDEALAPILKITIINSDAEVTTATEHLKKVKKMAKAVEDKEKFLIKPFKDQVQRIKDYAANLLKQVPTEETRIKNLILDFNKRKAEAEKKKRAESRTQQLLALGLTLGDKVYTIGKVTISADEISLYEDEPWSVVMQKVTTELERIKNEKLQSLTNQLAGADFFGEEDTQTIKEEMQKVQNTSVVGHVPSFGGGSTKTQGLTKRWTFEITDAAAVPREFLMIDETKIRQAIKDGSRSIAGVRIYQDESITIR